MVDLTKISALAEASSLASDDRIVIGQGDNAKKASSAVLTSYLSGDLQTEVSSTLKPSRSFANRAALVTHRASSTWDSDPAGTVYHVNGLTFEKSAGATDIADLADVTIFGSQTRVDAFGLFTDATVTLATLNAAATWATGGKGRLVTGQEGATYTINGAIQATGNVRMDLSMSKLVNTATGITMRFSATTYGPFDLAADYTAGDLAIDLTGDPLPSAPAAGTPMVIVTDKIDPANRDSGSEANQYRNAELFYCGEGSTTTNIVLERPLALTEAVSTTSISGAEPIENAYTTAANARVAYADPDQVCEIVLGECEVDDGGAGDFGGSFLTLRGYNRPKVTAGSFKRTYDPAIRLSGTIGAVVDGTVGQHLKNAAPSQTGYLVSDGGWGTIVRNVRSHDVRHTYTTNSNKMAADESDVHLCMLAGRTFGATITDSHASGGTNAHWDTHADAENVTFRNVYSEAGASSAAGIRGRKIVIDGLTAVNMALGLDVFTEYDSGDTDDDFYNAGFDTKYYTSCTVQGSQIEAEEVPVDVDNATLTLAGYNKFTTQDHCAIYVNGGLCRIEGKQDFVVEAGGVSTHSRTGIFTVVAPSADSAFTTGVVEINGDVTIDARNAGAGTVRMFDVDTNCEVVIRGRLRMLLPAGATYKTGSGAVRCEGEGIIEVSIEGGDDSTLAFPGNDDIRVVAIDATGIVGGANTRAFSLRADWILAAGNMAVGSTAIVREDEATQLYYKDGTSTHISDAQGWREAAGSQVARPIKQKWLLFSDMQPDANASGDDQLTKVDAIFAQMKTHHPDATHAIYPGDVVDRGYPSASEEAGNTDPWITLPDMRSRFDDLEMEVHVCPGNHDVDYRAGSAHPNGNTFNEYHDSFENTYYYVKYGSVIVIFTGDSHEATATRIPDFVVDWWEDVILRHQNDHLIIWATHAPLQGTLQVSSRVEITSTGTGDLSLGSADAGTFTFAASPHFADGDQMLYRIDGTNGTEWGRGTYNSGPNTITRDTLVWSTTGSAISTVSGDRVSAESDERCDEKWCITQSDRFYNLMARSDNPVRVDAIVSGHTGTNITTYPFRGVCDIIGGGKAFNVGLHVPSWAEDGSTWDMTYMVMELEKGSPTPTFRRWNVEDADYEAGTTVTITAPHNIKTSHFPEFDGRFMDSPRFGFRTKPTITAIPYNRKYDVDGTTVIEDPGPWDLSSYIIYDNQKSNVPNEVEALISFYAPGGLSGGSQGENNDVDLSDGVDNYGFAAAVGYITDNVSDDDDFSAAGVLYGSTSGNGVDSRVASVKAHSDGTVTLKEGRNPDYVSAWTEIDVSTASTSGTDFTHSLGLSDPYILEVKVYFYPGTGTRVYDWGGSSPVSDTGSTDRADGSISMKDGNTITLSVGNHYVFSKDNVDGGATTNYTSGDFLVVAWKVPGLPTLPTP